MDLYKGFSISANELRPNRWVAEIRRADGTRIKVDLPGDGGGLRKSIITDPPLRSAQDAISLAKQVIDSGSIT